MVPAEGLEPPTPRSEVWWTDEIGVAEPGQLTRRGDIRAVRSTTIWTSSVTSRRGKREQTFITVNVRSSNKDRTARAAIREAALRPFARCGVDGVTFRVVAPAAGVSPALVIRHYGSKEQLREAVDGQVAATLEAMLGALMSRPDLLVAAPGGRAQPGRVSPRRPYPGSDIPRTWAA